MNFDLFSMQMRMLGEYKRSLIDIEYEIDDIIYKYAGVRAIQYDKTRMAFNKNIADEVLDRMFEELKAPQKEKDRIENAIKELEKICDINLEKLPKDVQKMCEMVYLNKKTYESVGKIFGYTPSGLRYKIKAEGERI